MTITVSISGMSCENCVGHARQALETLAGVDSVEVSLAANQATLQTSGDVNDQDIRAALDEEGYEATAVKRG
jgi:copper chaperone